MQNNRASTPLWRCHFVKADRRGLFRSAAFTGATEAERVAQIFDRATGPQDKESRIRGQRVQLENKV